LNEQGLIDLQTRMIGEMNIHFGHFLAKGPTVAPAWVML